MVLCDLTSETDIEQLVANIPKLNGVVHAAGVFDMKPVKFVEKSDIESINSINYQAPVMLTQLLLYNKLLAQKASIVYVSSISAYLGTVGFGLYAASKGALTSFARVLALETAPQQIRVNCIAPGMVKTPMFDQTTDALSEEVMNDNEKLYPLGFVSPLDVAMGVQFLLSDASMKITGTTLIIDGGYSIA
jgi:NAD(P)-dependent dehydrogenase (short-subunit alcohol dehydrogenase family)